MNVDYLLLDSRLSRVHEERLISYMYIKQTISGQVFVIFNYNLLLFRHGTAVAAFPAKNDAAEEWKYSHVLTRIACIF